MNYMPGTASLIEDIDSEYLPLPRGEGSLLWDPFTRGHPLA